MRMRRPVELSLKEFGSEWASSAVQECCPFQSAVCALVRAEWRRAGPPGQIHHPYRAWNVRNGGGHHYVGAEENGTASEKTDAAGRSPKIAAGRSCKTLPQLGDVQNPLLLLN